MDAITKVIQKKLGMTLDQFCTKHLNCERQAFSVRLRKGKLYPNEYLYISLITDTPIKDLFGTSFEDTFIYRGDPEVSERLKNVISVVNDPVRLSELMSAEVSIGYKVVGEAKQPEPITQAPEPEQLPEPKEPEPQPELAKKTSFVFEDTFN